MKKSKTAVIIVIVATLMWVAYKIYEFANDLDEPPEDIIFLGCDSDAFWKRPDE